MKNAKKKKPLYDFKLDDLVLAKFEEYPDWPAIVRKCFWEDEKFSGKWHLTARGRRPAKLWCYFIKDDSANWVEQANCRPFTPNLNIDALVDKSDDSYNDLKEAMRMATEMYERRQGGGDVETEDEDFVDDQQRGDGPGRQSGSTGRVDDGMEVEPDDGEDMDPADSMEDVVTPVKRKRGRPRKHPLDSPLVVAGSSAAGPSTAGSSRGKGRKRRVSATPDESILPSLVSHRPSTQNSNDAGSSKIRKKRALDDTHGDVPTRGGKKSKTKSGATDSDSRSGKGAEDFEANESDTVESLREVLQKKEQELDAALYQIKKLRKVVKEKDALMGEYKSSPSKGLIDIPCFPDPKGLDIPPESRYQTKPITSEEFGKVLEELNAKYLSFKSNITKSIALRAELDKKILKIREELKEPCVEIEEQEKLAVADEIAITKVLGRILVAKVAMADLRQHRAGRLVNRVRKSCGEMPQIFFLSTKIADIWKEQVRLLHEQEHDEKEGSSDKQLASTEHGEPMVGKKGGSSKPNGQGSTENDELMVDKEGEGDERSGSRGDGNKERNEGDSKKGSSGTSPESGDDRMDITPSANSKTANASGASKVAPAEVAPAEVAPADAPSADAHIASASVADTPSRDASAADAPAVDAPAVDAPAADALAADASAADAPAVDTPASDAPAADTPASDAPTADAPTADAPAADAPAADAPAADAPAADAPAADAPAADAPTADAFAADSPGGDAAASDAQSADSAADDVVTEKASSVKATEAQASGGGGTESKGTVEGNIETQPNGKAN